MKHNEGTDAREISVLITRLLPLMLAVFSDWSLLPVWPCNSRTAGSNALLGPGSGSS